MNKNFSFNLTNFYRKVQRLLLIIIIIGVGAIFIIGLDSLQLLINNSYPEFPRVLFSIGITGFTVILAYIIWRVVRETDRLKQEFINVATHKFKTPLTHIAWTVEELIQSEPDSAIVQQLNEIKLSIYKLELLLELLATSDTAEREQLAYTYETVNFSAYIAKIVTDYSTEIRKKKVLLKTRYITDVKTAVYDKRMKFALRIVLDNALEYTPPDGSITILVYSDGRHAICTIKDSGIGISKKDIPHIFQQFYRGEDSKRLDTEGVGVGLFLARRIIEKHGGLLNAQSPGRGKGSTFTIRLPLR